ncbi:MAG: hypothetical protein AAFQ98_26665 [Bacteroidota bacterium]
MADSSTVDNLKNLLDEELAREAASPTKRPMDTEEEAPETWQVVQEPTPFQDSLLWQWQRDFFTHAGPEAWRQGVVPHYITSSSFVAHAYAQLVTAHQRDRQAAGQTAPLTVMELGGGSGQFSFHFLKHCQALSTPGLPPLRYVFTDVVEENLHFVMQHPSMAPFIASGVLDAGLFDVTKPDPVPLTQAKISLFGEAEPLPLVVIANYLWDSIPTELWRIQQHQAVPVHVSIRLPEGPEPVDFHRLPEADLQFSEGEPPATLPALAQAYLSEGVRGDVWVPQLGLQCMDWLSEKTGGQVALLSGDKAQPGASHLLPSLVHHGSFSLSVNFEAFAWWAAIQGGQTLAPAYPHRSLHVGWYSGRAMSPGPQLSLASRQWIEDFHPGDQFVLKRSVESHYDQMSPEEVLAYVRFSRYDPKALRRGLGPLMGFVNGYSLAMKAQILEVISRAWDNYYPMGEEPDLAFLIGGLLYEMDLFGEALGYFEFSAANYGPDEGTLANIKSCREMMKSPEEPAMKPKD